MESNLQQQTEQLISILTQIEHLLVAHGEQRWRAWISRDIAAIKNQDAQGIVHLLAAYGGMGSFSDLYLSAANGHQVGESEVISINDKLSTLRSRAYSLAKELERRVL
jgi:hypothetical protein